MQTRESKNQTHSRNRKLLWTALFAATTAVGGFVRIPMPLVPFTLQTLFVYLAADLLGSKMGAASQLLFLLLGLAGMPIFSAGGGPGYVLNPTFGYLVGFPVSAWVVGIIAQKVQKPERWRSWILANSVGLLIILSVGALYLYVNVNCIVHRHFLWTHALWSGFVIFLPAEAIKMFVAAGLARRLHPLMQKEWMAP